MTVGVLGGGQLGRMLALAGYPLGLQFRFYDPSADAPASQIAPLVVGSYDDDQQLERFASGLDVVTYEFENVPVEAVRRLQQLVPVYPPPEALEVSQDRLTEKNFFRRLEISTPKFNEINSKDDLTRGVKDIGFPAVLKTRRMGYDGKGQYLLKKSSDIELAWKSLSGVPLILEQWIPFERELSIISVRNSSGEVKNYPLIENHHREGILRLSLAPAPGISDQLQQDGEGIARKILEELNYVGVLAIELFQRGGRLIVNEMAPRVHNSGHWTIESAATSQFEHHLRAILNLPMGETTVQGISAMVNVIGNIPDLKPLVQIPDVHVHLYGKEARPDRKLGHVTLCMSDLSMFLTRLSQIQRLL